MSVVVHLDLREEVRAELVSGYQLGLPFLDDLSAEWGGDNQTSTARSCGRLSKLVKLSTDDTRLHAETDNYRVRGNKQV